MGDSSTLTVRHRGVVGTAKFDAIRKAIVDAQLGALARVLLQRPD